MLNILFLGPLNFLHSENFFSIFSDWGYEVTIINTEPLVMARQHNDNLQRKYKRMTVYTLDELFGNSLPSILRYLKIRSPRAYRSNYLLNCIGCSKFENSLYRILRENQIDLIFSYWGSFSFPEIKIIQKRFDTPIIHNFETYPVSLFPWDIAHENAFCRKPIERLDGRIHSTNMMLSYMKRNFSLEHGKDLVFVNWFSRGYFYSRRMRKLSDESGEPHIVFIGNTRFSNTKSIMRYIHPEDTFNDVRSIFEKIARKRIHIHMQDSPSPSRKMSDYIHTFTGFNRRKLGNDSLSTFMTQFDACVVLYNLDNSFALDRTYNSAPSRFLYALTAGIPIILPKGLFKGCERFVIEQEIGFAYSNYDELRSRLIDERFMSYYEKNALQKAYGYAFEENHQIFHNFIDDVIDERT